jgi:hypothetical protein
MNTAIKDDCRLADLVPGQLTIATSKKKRYVCPIPGNRKINTGRMDKPRPPSEPACRTSARWKKRLFLLARGGA